MEQMEVSGSWAFVIKEKFKTLKKRLRRWNKNVFGWVDISIDKVVKDMNYCDDLMIEVVEPMDVQVSNEREKTTKEFRNKL